MENQINETTLEAQKQEFLAIMSHELRTPMTVVKGYLSMILEGEAGEISSEVKEFIAQAYVANDRLINLVNNMIKVTRVQDGQFPLNLGEVNLSQTVAVLMSDFGIAAKEKNIGLEYQGSKPDLIVQGDPDRVREVIMQLVSNAIKFSEAGDKVTVSHRADGEWVITQVSDTGIGIKKEFQDKIFKLFAKENLNLADQERGTGLGLYLAKRLAEIQGGKVWLEKTSPGEGSTFCAAFKSVKKG